MEGGAAEGDAVEAPSLVRFDGVVIVGVDMVFFIFFFRRECSASSHSLSAESVSKFEFEKRKKEREETNVGRHRRGASWRRRRIRPG